ncbi:MAG: glutathione S-transferase family protein [Kaiparowitsia implicata GSE-PSE-MK54-09C]|jgi:glutathione S-transferase|nr:glutathione S-transferase family protein [Kaiparowitsia implicata GSE-PSE-MK54-09C]
MPTITVYGTPISTYVRTVRLLLEEAGVEYTLNSVDIFNGETKSADYLAKHPFGKVPTVDVGGNMIYETAAIVSYLDAAVMNGRFSPVDPLVRARMQQIMAIVDSYLYAPAIQTVVIQRLIVPSQGGETDEAAVEAAVAPLKTALEAIEALAVSNPYLLGGEISLADFHLIPIFVYLSKTPEFETAIAQSPKLQSWWSTAQALATVKLVCS